MSCYVEPCFVPSGELEAAVSTNRNVISFVTELTGKESFYGQGAGRYPTAYNAVADCADIIGGVKEFYTSLVRDVPVDNNAASHPYYVRLFRQRRIFKLDRGRKKCGEGVVTMPVPVAKNARMGSKGKGGRPRSVHSRADIIIMLKVAKFGGSSMADAGQFRKVKSIIEADPARKVIVVSAAGKRFKDDHKLTDLLYLCHAHKKYGVSCDPVFDMIADRYREICAELGLSVDIDSELSALREEIEAGISKDKLVSRGEYFSAKLMADFLGYDFLDAELWLHFSFDGTIDKERSYEELERLATGRRIVTPRLLRRNARRQHPRAHARRQRRDRRAGSGGAGR